MRCLHKKILIVGGGPTGLTLAFLLAQRGHQIHLIEEHTALGGCHRVERIDGKFGEHGPRIYSSSYVTFQRLLKQIGNVIGKDINFYKLFTPYKFQLSNIGPQGIRVFSLRELAIFGLAYANMQESYKWCAMKNFMIKKNFSPAAMDYVNRLCLMTDGADISNYSLWKFLQLINQEGVHQLYQPRIANDIGLFAYWRAALEKLGVRIDTGARIDFLAVDNDRIIGAMTSSGQFIRTSTVLLAMPPTGILQLISKSKIPHAFGPNFAQWVADTSYKAYYTICFEWNEDVLHRVTRVWGFPATQHGLAHIILSDYFDPHDGCKVLISCAFTIATGLDGLTDEELIRTAFAELSESYLLPAPDSASITSRPCETCDSAYVQSADAPCPLDPQSPSIAGLFAVGTFNGAASYAFTSLEAACVNAHAFVGEPVPHATTLNEMLYYILLFILLILVAICITFPKSYTIQKSAELTAPRSVKQS